MQGQNEMPDSRSEERSVIALRQACFVGLSFARGIIPFDLEGDIVRLDPQILNDDPPSSFVPGISGQNSRVDGEAFCSGDGDGFPPLFPIPRPPWFFILEGLVRKRRFEGRPALFRL
jgi:hypothetical protein